MVDTFTPRRILVATDFSEGSKVALRLAAQLARAAGGRLFVAHVLTLHGGDPVEAEEKMPGWVPAEFADLVEERRLERALTAELGILQAAREVEADLIVLGTHGRRGLAHVFLGSTAERVVQLASIPVLTVRHPDHCFEHPERKTSPAKKETSS
ncbi:MAG: universal stress protein [Planctomycetes bacterium]|nr:universal stress protein [Planctomycetota bacterium]